MNVKTSPHQLYQFCEMLNVEMRPLFFCEMSNVEMRPLFMRPLFKGIQRKRDFRWRDNEEDNCA